MRISLIAALTCILLAPGSKLHAQGWEWQNPLPCGYTINDIAILADGRALAVCNDGNVLRSWDTGRTWELTRKADEDLDHLLVLPDGVIFITGNEGSIYRSLDFASTMQQMSLPVGFSSGYTDLTTAPDGRILAVVGSRTVLSSIDEGDTWSIITPSILAGTESIRNCAARTALEWWCVGTRSIYHTMDAGNSWTIDSTLIARGMQRIVVVDTLELYQLREGQVLQTRDGGRTWREMNIFGFDFNIAIAAGRHMGEDLFILSQGNYLVNKSPDHGDSWNISLTSAAFPDAYANAMSFSSPYIGLVAGEGGRILRTEDGGATWSIVHGIGYIGSVSDLHFADSKNGFAFTFGETVLTTSNGGQRWTQNVPMPGWNLQRTGMLDAKRGFAWAMDSKYFPSVFHTSDLGRTWELRGKLPIFPDVFNYIDPQTILAVNDSVVWIGASYGLLYRSGNGGRSWDSTLVSTTMDTQYYSGIMLQYFPPSTYMYGASNGIAVSKDNGNMWIVHPAPFARQLDNIRFFSPDSGVCTLTGEFAWTTDGGVSWQTNSVTGLTVLRFPDKRHGFAMRGPQTSQPGTRRTSYVLHTEDGGASWTSSPLNERTPWESWFFVSASEGWAWGYGCGIRHTTNSGIVSAETAPVPMSAGFSISALYPNPASASRDAACSVTIDADGSDHVLSLDLVDVLGRTLWSRAISVSGPGRLYLTIELAAIRPAVSAGAYSLRLSSAGHSTGRSIIITR